MFNDIEKKCCTENNTYCACTHKEMILRRYLNGDNIRAMTAVEREVLEKEAVYFAEDYYTTIELSTYSDTQLAKAVLNAWKLYTYSFF